MLKKISHSSSPGMEKIEYFPGFKSFPLISISLVFSMYVCLLAPVLQYLQYGTNALSDYFPKIILSFLKGLLYVIEIVESSLSIVSNGLTGLFLSLIHISEPTRPY